MSLFPLWGVGVVTRLSGGMVSSQMWNVAVQMGWRVDRSSSCGSGGGVFAVMAKTHCALRQSTRHHNFFQGKLTPKVDLGGERNDNCVLANTQLSRGKASQWYRSYRGFQMRPSHSFTLSFRQTVLHNAAIENLKMKDSSDHLNIAR